jgi:dTDP-3,4-didehydro-2,6-dideoxy-alpha-D-glucose 3-reductase
MQLVKIGVLGNANIAVRSVIPAIKKLPQKFQLIGVATREMKLQESDSNFQFIQGYENILNKKLIDAVYIPLPNSLHYQYIKSALKKGIHVLVEKSLACNYEEVIELNDMARNEGLVLLENFQFRKHKQLKFILDTIDDGIIGELRFMRSTFCFPPFADKQNIRYKKELGGGALLDAGAYPVKLSQIILGNQLKIEAANIIMDPKIGVDILGSAQIKHNLNPVVSQISWGFDNYYQCNLELIGTNGKLYANRIFTAGGHVTPIIKIETPNEIKEIKIPAEDHFKNMLEFFYSLINSDTERNQEYLDNINQARLLNDLKKNSHEA